MQPAIFQDPMSVPRRQLEVEDYIEILRRHRHWILAPFLLCLVVGVVTAFLWTDTYVSSATIRVTPQQIPERFIPTNVDVDMSDRINSIYQSITSRTTLTNIINLYQLYPRDRKNKPTDDVVEQMRKDVKVTTVGALQRRAGRNNEVQAFQISFSYENRLMAQKVVEELVRRFINENESTRTAQSTSTTGFLQEERQKRKDELDNIDRKLTQFRVNNAGRLPEESGSVQSAITSIETRMMNLNATISRANQDKLILESRLQSLNEELRELKRPENIVRQQTGASPTQPTQLDAEVARQEAVIESMLQRYTADHPDVKNQMQNLNVLKARRDSLNKQQMAAAQAAQKAAEGSSPNAAPRPASPEIRRVEREVANTRTQIESRNLEIDNAQRELEAADRNHRTYQARLESIPSGIAEYEQLLREKTMAQQKYEEMNTKVVQSQSATELETRRQGETLELLDPASLPTSPTKPQRPIIIGAAAGLGLVIGILFAGVREMKDSTIKNLKDVRAYTKLTVLGNIPNIENPLVVRRRKRLSWLAWSTACLLSIIVMAASMYFYYANKS